jgi:hypothetical protein
MSMTNSGRNGPERFSIRGTRMGQTSHRADDEKAIVREENSKTRAGDAHVSILRRATYTNNTLRTHNVTSNVGRSCVRVHFSDNVVTDVDVAETLYMGVRNHQDSTRGRPSTSNVLKENGVHSRLSAGRTVPRTVATNNVLEKENILPHVEQGAYATGLGVHPQTEDSYEGSEDNADAATDEDNEWYAELDLTKFHEYRGFRQTPGSEKTPVPKRDSKISKVSVSSMS